MKSSVAVAVSLACAIAGFFGGRLSQSSKPADGTGAAVSQETKSKRGAAGNDAEKSSTKSGARRSSPRSSNKPVHGPLAATLQEVVNSFNNQDITLPDGSESELLLFDLAKFQRVMSAIDKSSEADIAELRELVRTNEDSTEDASTLQTVISLPLLARDIQLRGGRALDDEVARAIEDPVESNVEAVLPTMIYSLAIQSPAEAEAWLESYMKRTDTDDLIIDTDELRAAIDKARQEPSASK
jgi:hypothetical protein